MKQVSSVASQRGEIKQQPRLVDNMEYVFERKIERNVTKRGTQRQIGHILLRPSHSKWVVTP